MISVIVVYNDDTLFESMLRSSILRQTHAPELIAIDNRSRRFSSAAAALNAGGREARGDFLFFVHQDVEFDAPDWIDRAEGYLRELDGLGIAGVAGARRSPDGAQRTIVSNIKDSTPPQRAGHVSLTAPELVDTVDECAFFVPRQVFARHGFDEHTCRGWHLYAVDYSLTVQGAGLRAYALPLPLYHRSGGATTRVFGINTFEAAYFQTLRRVLAKHRSRVDRLHTTCGTWSAREPLLLQRFPPAAIVAALKSRFARSG